MVGKIGGIRGWIIGDRAHLDPSGFTPELPAAVHRVLLEPSSRNNWGQSTIVSNIREIRTLNPIFHIIQNNIRT